MIYKYKTTAHQRRHGPRGYLNYRSFKQWLRDDFCFTCAYCLVRERWIPSPADYFGADHVVAQSEDPTRVTDYDNLVYACCRCNSRKQHARGLPDPCTTAFGDLLHVQGDGIVMPTAPTARLGRRLIRILKLNEPELVEWRLKMFALLADPSPEMRRRWFGFPDDLPDLRRLRPPKGNSRREGVNESWFARRERDALPDTY